MGKGPLVTEEIDAGARFLCEFQKYMPVQTAFWLKDSEKTRKHLYVTSDQITDENFDLASHEAGRIIVQLQDPSLNLFRVKVIGADKRLAKAALDLQQRYPGQSPIHLFDESFGGVYADELYIYPAAVLATAPQRTLVGSAGAPSASS